jgi:tetratricopeptide (TPR) repeat protein
MLSQESGDFAAAENYARTLSAEAGKDTSNIIHGRSDLAYALERNGKHQLAASLIGELRRDWDQLSALGRANVDYAAGLLAYEGGKYDSALSGFDRGLRIALPNHAPQYYHALALLKLNRVPEAIVELQRYDSYSTISNPGTDVTFLPLADRWPIHSVKAHYWLGVAFEQQGKKEEAMREYRKFLEIWKDADFKSPELEDARARLAKLTGTAAK